MLSDCSSVGVRMTTVGQWTDLDVWPLGLSSRVWPMGVMARVTFLSGPVATEAETSTTATVMDTPILPGPSLSVQPLRTGSSHGN